MFGCVVAHQVEIGVRQVGLEAERLRHADFFQQVEHVLPAVHAGPADLTFGGQAFAMVGCDLGCFAESVGDLGRVGFGIGPPFLDAELGRVDANAAILPHAVFVEDLGDATGHAHG